jgi:hypothetical protein
MEQIARGIDPDLDILYARQNKLADAPEHDMGVAQIILPRK